MRCFSKGTLFSCMVGVVLGYPSWRLSHLGVKEAHYRANISESGCILLHEGSGSMTGLLIEKEKGIVVS
ncbi:hypothetical protein [Bartonella fuyuanensis]|uniref:hypothetical protein n=1 Tax=Bartonella fuyuanensis TaxID=1460968 RepID=UPI0016066A2B|nr:hypothetical protein [Bartonella fuyuanensis]